MEPSFTAHDLLVLTNVLTYLIIGLPWQYRVPVAEQSTQLIIVSVYPPMTSETGCETAVSEITK